MNRYGYTGRILGLTIKEILYSPIGLFKFQERNHFFFAAIHDFKMEYCIVSLTQCAK